MAIWSQQFFTIIREGVLALTFALGFSVITSAHAQIIVRDDAGVYVGVHAGGRVVRQIGDQAVRGVLLLIIYVARTIRGGMQHFLRWIVYRLHLYWTGHLLPSVYN